MKVLPSCLTIRNVYDDYVRSCDEAELAQSLNNLFAMLEKMCCQTLFQSQPQTFVGHANSISWSMQSKITFYCKIDVLCCMIVVRYWFNLQEIAGIYRHLPSHTGCGAVSSDDFVSNRIALSNSATANGHMYDSSMSVGVVESNNSTQVWHNLFLQNRTMVLSGAYNNHCKHSTCICEDGNLQQDGTKVSCRRKLQWHAYCGRQTTWRYYVEELDGLRYLLLRNISLTSIL